MPGRSYSLSLYEEEDSKTRQYKWEKIKRTGSAHPDSDSMNRNNYVYVSEVVKSPKEPQYEIHYVKTRTSGIQLVRKKKAKIGSKLLAKKKSDVVQQSASRSEDEETVNSETTVQSEDREMVGLWVIAWNKNDGLYYPGTVSNHPDATFALVTFRDKKQQKIRTQMIIPMCGAIPRPELGPGDFVLVRVYNQTTEKECYVPGIIEVPPEDICRHNKFYSVLIYNGQRETTLRRMIVKIGRARFEMAIRYITHIQHQRFLKEQQRLSDDSAFINPQDASSKKSDDDMISEQSSRSGRCQRKKEKLTKKLKVKKESEKLRKEKRSRSRSRSRTDSSVSSRSNSQASSGRRSRSRSSSKSRSRSGSSSGSTTPKAKSPFVRPDSPVPMESRNSMRKDEKDESIQTLQHQLEKQQRKQLRQEWRLVRQARKINKIQRKLKSTDTSRNDSVNYNHTDKSDREICVQLYNETEESSERRQEHSKETSNDYNQTASRTTLQMSPSYLVDKEVLARWLDDGWYYRGYVVDTEGERQYVVKDISGHKENIDRDDILTDNDHRFYEIQPGDYVIALHPKYAFSYAPAEVLTTLSNDRVKVEFFDGNQAELTSEDVYKIAETKYREVVDYIKDLERKMIGKSVVARDDDKGIYKLGVVDSRVGLGQQFYIKWLDGDMCKQNSNHIFLVSGPRTRPEIWQYVLAPKPSMHSTFMPAEIIDSDRFILQFCNGQRSADIRKYECFWISKDYYNNARNYYLDLTRK